MERKVHRWQVFIKPKTKFPVRVYLVESAFPKDRLRTKGLMNELPIAFREMTEAERLRHLDASRFLFIDFERWEDFFNYHVSKNVSPKTIKEMLHKIATSSKRNERLKDGTITEFLVKDFVEGRYLRALSNTTTHAKQH